MQTQNKKTIAIEGEILHDNMSGIPRYVLELAKIFKKNPLNNYAYFLVNNSGFSFKIQNKNQIIPIIPKIDEALKIDLYHRTCLLGSYKEIAKMLITPKNILTFHDLILYKNPDYFPDKSQYIQYANCMLAAVYLSSRIIAVSEHTKKDITSTFNIPETKIDVIYPGVDLNKFKKINKAGKLEELKSKYNLPENFLFYIGSDHPYKNLKNLYLAFAKIIKTKEAKDYKLVTAGNIYHNEKGYLKEFLDPIKDNVISLGYVSDSDVPLLYNASKIFVFPSLYEGFGFPVLEAFACEVPVVCSNAISLAEAAGDATLLVNPNSAEEIAKAVLSIINNPGIRNDLIKKGSKRVKNFTWENCALKTADTYKKTLEQQANNDFVQQNLNTFANFLKTL